MAKYSSMAERIVANTYKSSVSFYDGTACWIWTGQVTWSNAANGRTPKPYPVMSVRWKSGPRKGKVRKVRVHRESVRVFKEKIVRKDYVVMHLCNNSLCVNPDHLEGGTQKKNVRQCVEERRHHTPFRHKPEPDNVPF